jgi:hypothetical protein
VVSAKVCSKITYTRISVITCLTVEVRVINIRLDIRVGTFVTRRFAFYELGEGVLDTHVNQNRSTCKIYNKTLGHSHQATFGSTFD